MTRAPLPADTAGTPLAAAVGPIVRQNSGKTGFRLIDRGEEAYSVRLALIEAAEETLDAQYYVWDDDATGTVLLERLMAAADRGVRVRLLIDDHLYGREDEKVAALTVHPNIEIRLYNQFGGDASQTVKRYWDLVTNFGVLNHRMHNKFMIGDNQVAIIGGRNVGDHYYGVDHHHVFRDLDVVTCGPVVAQASAGFDMYWNSDRARPVEWRFRDFLTGNDATKERHDLLEKVNEFIDHGFPFPTKMSLQRAVSLLRPTGNGFGPEPAPVFWCDAKLVVDSLEKGDKPGQEQGSTVAKEIERLAQSAESEIVLESAYLVPRSRSLALLEQKKNQGVTMRLLTNSIASTNQMTVYAFYQKARPQLLKSGVEVHEVNSNAASKATHSHYPDAHLGVHAKTLIIDRKTSFVGTFNLDPRSRRWNSETGVVIESAAFAEHLLERLSPDFEPENSWRVRLNENGTTVWEGVEDGKPVIYTNEPNATTGMKFKAWFFGILPIGDQV